MKYQIQSYQLVYASGQRDTVKLPMSIVVENLDAFRKQKRMQYNCMGVNLTYVELNEKV